MLKFRRKPWQWTKETGFGPLSAMKSLKRCFAAMGKAWKLQLFQHFSRSRPKQRKTLKIAEKISHVLCAFISDVLKIRRKPGNYNFFSIFGRSRPKQRKTEKIAEKPNPLKGRKWQKPPKAKENLENCRENKPYAICLYVVTCSNSAGNLGNGRKKLGLVPLAQ